MSDKNDIHVMPVDDLREHLFVDCPCNPDVEIVGSNLLYIHHAWDHREIIERAEDILGIRR